jgi:hypothetical protein
MYYFGLTTITFLEGKEHSLCIAFYYGPSKMFCSLMALRNPCSFMAVIVKEAHKPRL